MLNNPYDATAASVLIYYIKRASVLKLHICFGVVRLEKYIEFERTE